MKKYSCIIFDMDGTLTQTNQLIYDSFNHIAAKYLNKTLTNSEIHALFGPPEQGAVENMIGKEHIIEAMDDYYRFYQNEHSTLAKIYPGTIDVLKYLHSHGIRIALFTGKGRRTTDITLEQFGISAYFDMTITGDDVEKFKPSGDGIRKILQQFSLVPDKVLMVGDAVADFKASRETGVDIASVLWDSYGKDDVINLSPDYLFHDVQTFFDWLKRIYA
ncbi:MAG: HAD family hydrolase [Bacteriovoracaceae bacterium]|nr:HAD family hydrolase [Bacteroidota bacterium]